MSHSFNKYVKNGISHRDYFNLIAPKWNSLVSPEPKLLEYMKRLGVSDGDRILDIGAGTGRLTDHLKILTGSTGQVVAEDISDAMLKIARNSVNNINQNCLWICADACIMPFKDSFFDKVICYSVFPHILYPKKAVREFYRVLRKNGKILILHTCCSRKLNQFHAKMDGIVCFDRLPVSQDLKKMLANTGFNKLKAIENPEIYWVEAEKA